MRSRCIALPVAVSMSGSGDRGTGRTGRRDVASPSWSRHRLPGPAILEQGEPGEEMTMRFLHRAAALALGAACFAMPATAQQSPIPLRVAGHFTANTKQVDGIERPFFVGLARETGINLSVTYNPMDQVGVQAADALRHLRTGAFDVMSVLIGQTARDEPFIDSLDLIGVSTTLDETRTAVDAGREALDRRVGGEGDEHGASPLPPG